MINLKIRPLKKEEIQAAQRLTKENLEVFMEYTTGDIEYYFNRMMRFFPLSVKSTLLERKRKRLRPTDDAGVLMGKTRAILASDTHWSETLKINITVMYEGLEAGKDVGRRRNDRPKFEIINGGRSWQSLKNTMASIP